MSELRNDYDTPWKEILDTYFALFMQFCCPDIDAQIDWSRQYESLDKELNAIAPKAEVGKRIVDKLFKVWRIGGEETWVLLHIEIQGQKDPGFEERMFVYHYRIFDRYHKPVMSMAILTDDGKNWRPHKYNYKLWGCKLSFEFIIVKLLDYADKINELMQSTNPFAMVIKIQLIVLQTGNVMEERYQVKVALTRALYKKGYCKEDILNLYSFIDWLIQLPEPLELEYNNEVQKFEEEQQMAYITSAERFGIQKGIEQGIKQGIEKGELRLLQRLLAHKFGDVPVHYYHQLEQANADELLVIGDRILEATKVEDVFV